MKETELLRTAQIVQGNLLYEYMWREHRPRSDHSNALHRATKRHRVASSVGRSFALLRPAVSFLDAITLNTQNMAVIRGQEWTKHSNWTGVCFYILQQNMPSHALYFILWRFLEKSISILWRFLILFSFTPKYKRAGITGCGQEATSGSFHSLEKDALEQETHSRTIRLHWSQSLTCTNSGQPPTESIATFWLVD